MQKDFQSILAGFLDALGSAAIVAGCDGRVLLRNSAADRMLPPGGHVAAILDVKDGQAAAWPAVMAALADGAPCVTHRSVRLGGSGARQLTVDINVRPITCRLPAAGADGGSCVLVLVEDVSSRISTQRRQEAGRRMEANGPLAARIAHELNNPLDGVMRYLGLAERTSGPEAQKYLAPAREGLVRMAQIIRGLLNQGRPWQVAGEPASLQRVLDEAVGVMQPRAQSLGVTVICDFDDRADGLVEASAFQVFCNIIKNALDAMPGGGMLKISASPSGKVCEIVFADNGSGLTAEEAECVFEPFYTTKPPGEGSGLGLALCREILQHLGGAITAEPNPAGGAIFRVRLPQHAAWGEAKAQDAQQ
jgi:signal transduction histidine kinase